MMYARCLLVALVALLLPTTSSAITIGTYSLLNHPDGLANPPPYGLRLDGLLDQNAATTYTFDFDAATSNMQLTWDGSQIRIFGQAFGGQDNGSGYLAGTTAVWDIDFTYNVGVTQPGDGGLDDLIVNANNTNFGTISSTLGNFQLEDKSDNSGMSFQFGDENGSGHRGFGGISGWGWVNHGTDCITQNCNHLPYSDWLFTAVKSSNAVVPVPAAVWLFGSAMMGLVLSRRKLK